MNCAINIDCMEYMRTLPDLAFDLAVVDPPYGINKAFHANGQVVGGGQDHSAETKPYMGEAEKLWLAQNLIIHSQMTAHLTNCISRSWRE